MITVYCDESHDSSAAVLAGWAATPSGWDRFSPAWRAMLARHPLPSGEPMPSFHASEIANRDQIARSRFRGWTRDQEIAAFSDAVDQIVDPKVSGLLWPVGCGVRLPPIKGAHMTDDLWRILFVRLLFALLNQFPAQNGFTFVFDEKPEVQTAVNRFYTEASEMINAQSFGKLDGNQVHFGKDEDHEPLQAADLWAYEWRKRLSNCIANPNPATRTSFRRIFTARERNHAMYYYNLNAIKDVLDRQAAGDNFFVAMTAMPPTPQSFWVPTDISVG